MPNLLSPMLIAVSGGITYPMASVVDSNDANLIDYSATISGDALSLQYNISAGTYSNGSFPHNVKVYEISSYGWNTAPTLNTNQITDYAYLKGDDGCVYLIRVSFKDDGAGNYNPLLTAQATDLNRPESELPIVQKLASDHGLGTVSQLELLKYTESSGAVVELSGRALNGSGRLLSVREVNGLFEVYQKHGVLPVTEPVYLYASEQTILLSDKIKTTRRWDQPLVGKSFPQRDTSGVISFTNNETLVPGSSYKLVLDCGNLGNADPLFDGFTAEVSVSSVTFPAKLCAKSGFAIQSPQRFVLFANLDTGGAHATSVATHVRSLKPDDIFVLGNLSDGASFSSLDNNFGSLYGDWVYPYSGSYGSGAPDNINRIWGVIGNHDWSVSLAGWNQFFTGVLPGNKRYYDVRRGDTHFFIISNSSNETDGITANSVQGLWLKTNLANSSAKWKIVLCHFPIYTSEGGYLNMGTPVFPEESSSLQWPFKAWGASMVVCGHPTSYERIEVDGFTYVNVGTGGDTLVVLPTNPIRDDSANGIENISRNSTVYGTFNIHASEARLLCEFSGVDGAIYDTFELNAFREKTEFEFLIPSDAVIPSNWTLGINWTNDASFSAEQGYSRALAVYGYELRKKGSDLYKAAINTSNSASYPTVTKLTQSGSSLPGTYVARFNSRGLVLDYTSELNIVPKDDLFVSHAPLADILTGSTDGKKDDVSIVSSSVADATTMDPYVESSIAAPVDLSISISISSGPYKVGDSVTFTATPGSGQVYVWTFWDGISVVGGNVFIKILNRGGTNLPVGVTVSSPTGRTGYATTQLTVNAPPNILAVGVSDNDESLGYTTLFTVNAIDDGLGTVGITLRPGSPTATPFYTGTIPGNSPNTQPSPSIGAYTVSVPITMYVVATDGAGGTSVFPVDLRGAVTNPPAVSLVVSSLTPRIGPGQLLTLTGTAVDVNHRGSTSYNYVFTFWDGSIVSGGPMTLLSTGVYQFTITKDISLSDPGLKKILFSAIDPDSLSSSVGQTVTLIQNTLPIVDSLTSSVVVGQSGAPVLFKVAAHDPDGDPLTYRWEFASGKILTTPEVTVQTAEIFTENLSGPLTVVVGTLSYLPVKPGSLLINFNNGTTTDNGLGGINAAGTVTGGTINYSTGEISIGSTVAVNKVFGISYAQDTAEVGGLLRVSDPYGGTVVLPIPTVPISGGTAITSPLSVIATIFDEFSYQITASGQGPFTFTASPLPAGLSVNAETGLISGSPSALQVSSTIITVKTVADPTIGDTKTLTLTVSSTGNTRPLAPTNLRVFDDGVNPTYSGSSTELPIRWNITLETPGATVPSTRLEFRTLSDELRDVVVVDQGIDNYSYPISTLLQKFGVKNSLVIRAYHVRGSLLSLSYDKVEVTKI